jgi:hypothetical protein
MHVTHPAKFGRISTAANARRKKNTTMTNTWQTWGMSDFQAVGNAPLAAVLPDGGFANRKRAWRA